jgi:hypothetical protein
MIFEGKEKRTGKKFIVCSKFWPDGSRFRRRYPNKTIANQVRNRIIGAIALGTWRELKKELTEGPKVDYTIESFAEVYLEEYCKIRNTRPDFKEETLEVITRIVGDRKLKHFTKADAHYFEKERAKEVSNATVNRSLAVLSNMLTFACRKELISVNPMSGYGELPVDETVRSGQRSSQDHLAWLSRFPPLPSDAVVTARCGRSDRERVAGAQRHQNQDAVLTIRGGPCGSEVP